MSSTDLLVILGGIAAIVWINWWFFVAGRRPVAAEQAVGGVQEVRIEVRGGYDPAVVRLRPGTRVRLVFVRREEAGCSEEVVLPHFGVRRYLPPYETTAVELPPLEVGSYEFTCGMSMLRGKLIVAEAGS